MRGGWTIAALMCAMGAAHAPAEAASPWGILHEMVGRDFSYAGGYATAVRWLEQDRMLEIHYLAPGIDVAHVLTLRPDGTLVVQDRRGSKPPSERVTALRGNPDGSLSIAESGQLWMGRESDGRIFQVGAKSKHEYFTPLDPASGTGQWMAKMVAKGKVRAADAGPVRTAGGSGPSPTTAGSAPVMAALPPSEAQVAGLEGYVGKSFASISQGQPVAVVRTRWIDKPTLYELSILPKFGKESTTKVAVAESTFNLHGLPVVRFPYQGKEWQQEVLPGPTGYVVVNSENRSKPGKTPKWKERNRTERRIIAAADADRLLASFKAEREARWAPLAALTKGPWFCVQMEPGQWLERTVRFHAYGRTTNRSYPVMRLTTARWIDPWQELEVVSTLGEGRKVTDRIVLLSNGNFQMDTTGVSRSPKIVGQFSHPSGSVPQIDFVIAHYERYGSDNTHGLLFYVLGDATTGQVLPRTKYYAGGASHASDCEMEPFDAKKLDTYSRKLTEQARWTRDSMQSDQEYWSSVAQSEAEGQAMLANMRGELFRQVFVGIPQAIAEVNQQKAQLQTLRIAAEQETAMRRAAEAAAAAEKAEQARLARAAVSPSNSRGTGRGPAPGGSGGGAQLAAQRQAQAKADAQAKASADALAQTKAQADQRRADAARQEAERKKVEAQRLAEKQRKAEEAERLIEYREGVVLCEQKSAKSWRCDGPLQVTYGDLGGASGPGAISSACGGGSPRKLGMAAGYMAYGCGFGIHPSADMRSYPGNRDVQAALGVGHIPGQGFYRCKRSVLAYCRGQ